MWGLDVEELMDHEIRRGVCTDLYAFEFADLEDFKLEYRTDSFAALTCTAN